MQRHGDLENVLDGIRGSAAKDVNTSFPATVVAYNATEQRATIRIGVFETTPQGRKLTYPDIQDVPCVFPSSAKSSLTFPLSVGDSGLFIISKHSIDNWVFGTGAELATEDTRIHQMQDGFFLVGATPFSKAPSAVSKHKLSHSTSDLVLTHNLGTDNEAEVRITPAGAIKATGKTEVKMVVGSNSIKINTSEIKLVFGGSSITLNSSGVTVVGTAINLN